MNIENETNKILEEFHGFTDGVRMLMLCIRNKDGGSNNERTNTRMVSRNEEQFEEILVKYLEVMKMSPETPYRIYSSANKRDAKKAMRIFKYKQLDAEYNSDVEIENFFFDIKNRWLGSLMSPKARMEKNFLFDIDEGDEKTVEDFKKEIASVTRTYKIYQTKNGYHAVVPPFNPQLMPGYDINKDGLLLLKY